MGIEIATSDDFAKMNQLLVGIASEIKTLAQTIEAMRQEQTPEWLTVKEAANHLRVTPDTIRRRVSAGHFDTRREGKSILISRECVLNQSSR